MPSPRTEKASSLPFVDQGKLLSGADMHCSSELSTTAAPAEQAVATKKSEGESTLKAAPSQQVEKTPSLMAGSSSFIGGALATKPGAVPVTCDTTTVPPPCTTIQKGTNAHVEASVPTTASNEEDGSAVKPKLLFRRQDEKPPQAEMTITEEAPRTPVSTRRYQELPSSTDSTQDDLTLAEMELLVNRFGPRSRFSKLPAANRNLDQALQGASENVNPQVTAQTSAAGIVSTSLNRCLPLVPTPTECTGSTEEAAQSSTLLDFVQLVNFPQYRWERVNSTEELKNKRHCVMCGNLCPCFKKKKDDTSNGTIPFVVSDSKGICTSCEAQVWVVQSSSDDDKALIRFCQQCRKFHPFAAFASKRGSLISTCVTCREQKSARAKRRREEKAARLVNEKKKDESNRVDAAPGKESNDSTVLGKRKSVDEESVTSAESSAKRLKSTEETTHVDESITIGDTDKTSKESPMQIDTDAESESSSSKHHSRKPTKEVSTLKNGANDATSDADEVQIVDQPTASSSRDRKRAAAPVGIAPMTRNRCVPIPSDHSDNALEQSKNVVVPVFSRLSNFSQCLGDSNTKKCVMCGHFRPSCLKKPKGDANVAFIPFGSKDVCSSCQDTEWLVVKSQVRIKWCNQGSHFRPLAAFTKGKKSAGEEASIVKSCSACRDLAASYNHGK